MTASADKVQFLLQNSLQQTLPLLKKGIFTQQQLRQIMLQRQKHQNKLYSSTFKLSHFLKAIQFEYDLQRNRIYKIKNQQMQNVNPLFKKQAKTDFSIIKRIMKLWDRTMHKFKYRTYLWKQYLQFCIAINSKKHFYKALTNSLRFLPFELQLWKIGVRYQVQIGKNKWKARKLFHKGLKLVPSGQKNIQLTKQLIKFELQFVQSLQMRQKIIKGLTQQQQNDMKFIMGDNNQQKDSSQQSEQNQGNLLGNTQTSQLLNLRQYHEILFIAINDSINKNYKSKTYFRNNLSDSAQQRCKKLSNIYIDFLIQLKKNQQNQLIIHILNQTIQKVKKYKKQLIQVKLQEKFEDQQGQEMQIQIDQQGRQQEQEINQYQIQEENINNNKQRQLSQQQKYSNQILQKYKNTKKFEQKLFLKVIKQYCLKPSKLQKILEPIINILFSQSLNILSKNEWLNIPLNNLKLILSKLNKKSQFLIKQFSFKNYINKQIKKINSKQFIQNIQLLRQIIKYNINLNIIQENNIIFRSILVNCKSNVQFIQRAKCLFTQ